MEWTRHATVRAKNRSIGQWVIDLLMDYGLEYDVGNGCRAYFVGRRLALALGILPCQDKAVVVYDQQIITVHHCHHPPRSWRRLA